MSAVERLGRVKHETLGKCVLVKLRHWEGPMQPGRKGCEVWTECLVPADQSGIQRHPRHITAFDPAGEKPKACISPSCSYFNDLCRYANIRWVPRAEAMHGRGG